MAEKNNQDLAVLGFSVKAESAMQALEQLDAKLRNIDANFKKADAALERKIVSTLAAIEKPMGKLDRTSAVVASFGEAFKQFAAAAKTEGMADALHLVTTSIEALSKSGLEKVAATYAKSLGAATMAFGQLGDSVTHTVGGISAIMSGVFDAKNADALKNYIKSLSDAKEMLSGYTNEFGAKKLPFGVTVTNIKAAQRELESMITTAQTYADLLDPNNKRTKIDIKNSANALLSQFQKQQEYVHNAMMGLFPNGGTVKISAELVNAEQITAALPKTIQVSIEQTSKEMLTQFFTSIDEMKQGLNEIHVDVPQADLEKIKNKIDNAVEATIMFQSGAEESLSRSFEYIKKSIEKKAKIVIPIALVDANGVQVEQPAEAVKELVQEVEKAVDEEAKKAAENPPPNLEQLRAKWRAGIYEELIDRPKLLSKMEERGQMFREDIFDPAMEGNEKAVERLKKLMAAVGYTHGDVEVMLSETLPGSTQKAAQEAEKAVEQVAQKVSEAPEKVAQAAIGKADVVLGKFMERIQPQASKIGEMLTFQPTLPENWQETIKAQIQAFKSVAIETVTVSPKTLTVDTSSSVAKLMNEPLHVKGANVMVHPAAIKVDTAFVDPKSITLEPNPIVVHGGNVVVVPQSLKVNIPAAIQNLGIIALQKPVTASAPVVIQPTSFTFKQSAFNKINMQIGQPLNVNGYVSGIQQVQNAMQQLVPFATNLATQLAAIQSNLGGGLAQLLTAKNVNAINSMANNAQAKQANQQKQQQALAALGQMLKKPLNNNALNQARQTHEKVVDKLVQNLSKGQGIVRQVTLAVDNDINTTTQSVTTNIQNADAALQANNQLLQQNANAYRTVGRQIGNAAVANAKMAASVVGVNAPLRQLNLNIHELEQVTQLNLADPFKKMKAEIGDTGSRIADLGRSFGLYFSGRSIINFFRQAAESANSFGLEIRRIQSLATDFDFTNLRNELMDIDARFGNVIHNAQALYWAYSSGVRGTEKELARFTETMSKTATTIKADVMPTVDAATSLMNAFNLSAGSAGEIGDLLFSVIKFGKSNASQLTTALGHVVAPAAALNMNMNELGASIATLTKTMKTNRALTYLSNILGKLASPTKKVQEAAAEFGIELSANAIKARGFAQTLRDIRAATGGDVGKIAKLFPDLRGQRAAITLLSTQYKDFEQQLVNMENKAGAMEEALSRITDTPESQLRALKNTISMVSIGAGDAVNNVLTLGGALGPILKTVNGLEHGGRELLGHLVAAAGATGAIAVAMKAVQAAQFATAKTAYEMASAESETKRNQLDIALTMERQALEANKMAVAEANAQIAARVYNNLDIQRLNTRKEILEESIRIGRQDVENARSALKFENEYARRKYEDMASGIGQSSARIAMLRGMKVDETTGQSAQKMERDIAILDRLQATITAQSARLDTRQASFIKTAHESIRNYVQQNANINAQLTKAINATNVDNYEKYTKQLNTVVNKIKQTTAISSEMNQFINGRELLEMSAKEYAITDLRQKMTEGTAFSHQLIVRLLDEEIKKENSNLETLRAQLNTQLQADKVNADRRLQVDAIANAEEKVAKLEQTRSDVIADIEARTKDLTEREREYVQILQNNVKLTKTALDNDTLNTEKLKQNIDLALRNAAVIGKDTLAAVRATGEAQFNYHSALVESRAVEAEILRMTDADKNLIDNSVANQQKLLDLEARKVELLRQAVDERKRFIALGVRSGDVDARNARIAELQAHGASLNRIVAGIARDKGVVSEAIKQMSAGVGREIFGGKLGGRGAMGLSMLSSFVPGFGKFGMATSMLASFNVFGRAASGMTNLTGTMLKFLGTTEKLQKKGFVALDKGVEDLTKSLMTSLVWTKKQALANKALMGLSAGGAGGQAALAGTAVNATWATAGIGVAIGAAIFAGLYAYFKNNQSPFDGLAESIFGVDVKKQFGDILKQRNEYFIQERDSYITMGRELQRMISIQEEQKGSLSKSIVAQRELNALRQTLNDLDSANATRSRRFVLENQQAKLREMEAEYAGLSQTVANAGYDLPEEIRQQYQQRINELETLIPQQKAKIEQTKQEVTESFSKELRAWSEYRYQTLRELMEGDFDSAFAPMLDAAGKLQLAEKTTSMSLKRIAELLTPNDSKNIIDLSEKSTDDIRNMMRERIKVLSDMHLKDKAAYLAAQKVLDDNVDQKDSKEYQEAEKKVEELKTAMENSGKNLDEYQTNVRNALNDYYSKISNQVNAFVNKIKDEHKQVLKKAKFNAQFTREDDTFVTLNNIIFETWDAINKLRIDFKNKAGIFKGKNDDEAQKMFNEALRQLDEEQMSNITNNVSSIKSMQENLARFMETQANDVRAMSKQQFDFRMSNPAFARMRPQLMKARMQELNGLMAALIPQRNEAFQRAQELMGQPGQMVRAQAALEEAFKFEKQAKGVEQEQLELVKKRADIERSINQSMYQLASVLQGKFESTAQTAVDAYSVESIRLQMRRIGENIAPAINTSAQELESKMMEKLFEQNMKNQQMLMAASLKLQEQITNQSQNADKMGSAAVTMDSAAKTADTAAKMFKTTVERNRTTFRVKRI